MTVDLKKALELVGRREWHELPRLLGMLKLIGIREDLRAANLHDTEEPALPRASAANLDPRVRLTRMPDGGCNDLDVPAMGSAGRRFGRSVPLDRTFPDSANLLHPSPRLVSRELMTRHEFQPATTINLLAAAWVQFMVHDWFVHKRSTTDVVEIPLAPGDEWPDPAMRVPRTEPDPAPPGSTRPPAYANLNSHWGDASMLYGCDAASETALRTGNGGRLRLAPNNLLPVDSSTGLHASGFSDNWWVGLAMLHLLFALEHNHVCGELGQLNPTWNDQRIFGTARLIVAALMAKIHMVEWSAAILPHPTVGSALHANWSGLLGEDLQHVFECLDDKEMLGGIVGSNVDHHGVPYSLTEEFVAVYRMHPLMPDDLAVHSVATGDRLETLPLPEVAGRRTPAVFARVAIPDLFYSFGIAHPGAVKLHNYPRFLQTLTREDGARLDLAAVDIFRDRERGVPRYNEFRRLLHKKPVASFDELTDNPVWRRDIRRVYNNDLEKVDLMTGLYAEPLPYGFGFSETAFRLFVLMASRRLKSDRFFTDDYRPEVYTEFGLEHVRRNSMLTVLGRHIPQVASALAGVKNAFQPWTRITETSAQPASV
jgi:hypothetical protein